VKKNLPGLCQYEVPQLSVGIGTGLQFRPPRNLGSLTEREKHYLFSTAFTSAIGHAQPQTVVQWAPW
jgi:hypothetical protein